MKSDAQKILLRSALLALILASLLSPVSAANLKSLDNGTVRITVDLDQGGGIVAFHPTGRPQDSVINTYDRGRNCQQSYYSGPSQFKPAGATQNPNWNPWPWNPVQGGDCYGSGSATLSWSNNGGTLYVKSRPKQWALQNYDADCVLEQWITLDGSVATVRNRLINGRSDTTQYPAMHQELGALYTWRALGELWTYTGTEPFTGGALTKIPKTAPPWAYFRGTEGWAAYTMSTGSKWGVGIFVPGVCSFIGGFDGSTTSGDQSSANTGYIAPIRSEIIDHNIVYEFTYELILGNLNDIRNYAVARQANLKPNFLFRGTRAGWTYSNASDSGYPLPADRLRVNVGASDPIMWGPECSFQAAEVPRLYIRAAHHCAGGGTRTAQIFWERENGASPVSAAQSQSFTAINDGTFRLYTVDLSNNAQWTGQISRLRFDPVPSGVAGDYVEVLGITSTPPGVEVTQSGGSTTVAEGGATDTYTVVLTGEPTSDVTITSSPNAQVSVWPTSLTFTSSNWNTPQTVTVSAVNDPVAEGTHSGTITHAAASADPGYNGIAMAAVIATITDDDTSGVVITQSSGSTAVTEGGATDTYTLVLTSQPLADVVITPSPANVQDAQPSLIIYPTNDGFEVTNITAANPGLRAISVSQTSTTVAPGWTLYGGGDGAGLIALVANGWAELDDATNGNHNGTTSNYGQALYIRGGDGKYGAAATDASAYAAQEFTLSQAYSDVTVQFDYRTRSTLANLINVYIVAADNTVYSLGGKQQTTTDMVNFSTPDSASLAAGTYTLYLVGVVNSDYYSALVDNVKITAIADQLTVSPASLTFSSSNWNTPQTVTVAAVNDSVAEGTHSGTITHAAASADPFYNGIAVADVTATITDDVSSFSEWTGGGVPMTSELLAKYAVGGAASPADSSEPLYVTLTDSFFILTALVRTNDPSLSVVGMASTSLSKWDPLPTNPSGTPSENQTGVPYGWERRDFSIPVGMEPAGFLRLTITVL